MRDAIRVSRGAGDRLPWFDRGRTRLTSDQGRPLGGFIGHPISLSDLSGRSMLPTSSNSLDHHGGRVGNRQRVLKRSGSGCPTFPLGAVAGKRARYFGDCMLHASKQFILRSFPPHICDCPSIAFRTFGLPHPSRERFLGSNGHQSSDIQGTELVACCA